MTRMPVHSSSSDECSRTQWLAQTLDRVDHELIREEACDEPLFIVRELEGFREYLREELVEAHADERQAVVL